MNKSGRFTSKWIGAERTCCGALAADAVANCLFVRFARRR